MNAINNIPSKGTFGAAVEQMNQNFGLIVTAINELDYKTTRSKGILNNGTTPASAITNAVKGDWCMVLGSGNTFPATIYTYNGTTWNSGGTWSPSNTIDLQGYYTKTQVNDYVAEEISKITIETADNLTTETTGKALDARQGFVLAGQIDAVRQRDVEFLNSIIEPESMGERHNKGSFQISNDYIISAVAATNSTVSYTLGTFRKGDIIHYEGKASVDRKVIFCFSQTDPEAYYQANGTLVGLQVDGAIIVHGYDLSCDIIVPYDNAYLVYYYYNKDWVSSSWKVLRAESFAERINEIERNSLESYLYIPHDISKTDCEAFRVKANSSAEHADGTRLRIVKEITSGAHIQASCSMGKGVAAGVWATKDSALKSNSSDALEDIALSAYVSSIDHTTSNGGYLCISLCKDDGTKFSNQEVLEFIDNLSVSIDYSEITENNLNIIEDKVKANEKQAVDACQLYIGNVVNAAQSATQLNPNDAVALSRVTMSDVISVPYDGVKVHVKLPKGICMGYRTGLRAENLDQNIYWFTDGQDFTIQQGYKYYRITFSRFTGDDPDASNASYKFPLHAAEVMQMIADGDISLTYEDKDGSTIMARNHEAELLSKSFMADGTAKVGALPNNYTVIVHTSDVHGDQKRLKQVYDFADSINADYCMLTGDFVAYTSYNGARFVEDVDSKHNRITLICVGNHDVNMVTSNTDIFTKYIQYFATKYGYVGTQPYYYHDDTTRGIRFIALNLYDGGHATSNTNCKIEQAQIEWLIQTLQSTPGNYGVILMYHAPELPVVNAIDNSFIQRTYFTWETHTKMSGTPISKIVNAFIGRESISGTYSNDGVAVAYSADFSSVATGAHFIAHCNGHEHTDAIGYYQGYDGSIDGQHKQIVLNVPCTQALYGNSSYPYLCNLIDAPRGGVGAAQDSFNVYIIDKDLKRVCVVKVGSNMAYGGRSRKFIAINYE